MHYLIQEKTDRKYYINQEGQSKKEPTKWASREEIEDTFINDWSYRDTDEIDNHYLIIPVQDDENYTLNNKDRKICLT